MFCVQLLQSFFESHPLLESIKDYGGVLSIDEIWNELAKLEPDDWKMVVDEIPKESESGGCFRFYCKIKTSPTEEDYILRSSALNKRQIITQWRCGCLPLEIETGCYRSPKMPLSERVCQLCNSDIGTETHFLLAPREDLTKSMLHIYPDFTSLTKCYGSYKPVQHPQQWVHQFTICTVWDVIYWGDQTLQLLYLFMLTTKCTLLPLSLSHPPHVSMHTHTGYPNS